MNLHPSSTPDVPTKPLLSAHRFTKPDDVQLQSTARVLASARDILSTCPTSRYLLVSQPTVHANDLTGPSGCQSPSLCRALEGKDIKGRFSVAEILGGDLAFGDFSKHIKDSCQSKGRVAKIEERLLPALPSEQPRRAEVLAENGMYFPTYLQWCGKTRMFAANTYR